jgi:hypothetical protein
MSSKDTYTTNKEALKKAMLLKYAVDAAEHKRVIEQAKAKTQKPKS